jgi:hypothetical protein
MINGTACLRARLGNGTLSFRAARVSKRFDSQLYNRTESRGAYSEKLGNRVAGLCCHGMGSSARNRPQRHRK